MFEEYKKYQPIAYQILKKTIDSGNYNHAYLIEKNNYEKSFDFVLSFIKEIFYKENTKEYTKEQISLMIDNNEFSELSIIDTDGQWIKKEQLLALQEEFSKKSIMGNKKIYIINNADKLNTIAANSILKFLEEPQEGIIAILICDNRYKIINTILSRCQIINLNGQAICDENEYFYKIKNLLNIKKEEDIEKIKENIQIIINFIKFFEINNKKILLYINKYWYDFFTTREDIYNGLVIILLFYKDMLNYKLNRPMAVFNCHNEIEELAKKNSIKAILKKIDIIDQNIQKIEYNANLNLLMDKLIIEMSDIYDS